MSAWWRTRRAWWALVALGLCAPAAYVLQTRALVLPIAFGADGLVLGTTFLPLIWSLAVADCFASKSQAVEVRPARRLLVADVALLTGFALAAATTFAFFAGPHQAATGAAGHALLLTGVAVVIAMRAGTGPAALVMCALLMTTTLYGLDAPGGRYVRVLQPDGDPTWAFLVGGVSIAAAIVMCIAGATKTRLGATHRFNE